MYCQKLDVHVEIKNNYEVHKFHQDKKKNTSKSGVLHYEEIRLCGTNVLDDWRHIYMMKDIIRFANILGTFTL